MRILRDISGETVNRIVNDPDVRPWIIGAADRTLDLSRMASDPRCWLLVGEPPLGAQIAWRILDGVAEFHSAVLPSGRGEWALEFFADAVRYMFCTTDAIELITRIPQGNLGALTLARRFLLQPRWICPSCWYRGQRVPYAVWSLTMMDWMPSDLAGYEAAIEDIERAGLQTKAANWLARRAFLSREVVG